MEEELKQLEKELEELYGMSIRGRNALSSLGNREFDRLSEMLDSVDEKIEIKQKEIEDLKNKILNK